MPADKDMVAFILQYGTNIAKVIHTAYQDRFACNPRNNARYKKNTWLYRTEDGLWTEDVNNQRLHTLIETEVLRWYG
jgi:hypothetical protein